MTVSTTTLLRVPASLVCLALCSLAQTQSNQPLRDAPLPPARVALPQLGSGADELWSPTQERALGRLIWRDLRSQPDVLTDTLLDAYLHDLTRKLAMQTALPDGITLRSFAVADTQLNAFAMPGGLMGIHTGLMLNVAQEGELAAVMAHEIGHISQRHFARSMGNRKNDGWIALAGFAAAVIAARNQNAQNGSLVEGALLGSQALAANRQLSFSRDMEREADTVGFALLQGAQYDATDMVRMLRRLGAASSFLDSGAGASYAKSHPGTTERMASIEGRLRSAATPANSEQTPALSFLLAQARARALLAISPERIDDAQTHFKAQLTQSAKHSRHAQIAAQYGLLQMALQTQQWTYAQSMWTSLAPLATLHPWIAAQGLELDLNRKGVLDFNVVVRDLSPAAAVHVLQIAMATPTDPRKQMLSDTQSLNTAQSTLNNWLSQHPHSDSAWQALASVHQQKATLIATPNSLEKSEQLAYAAYAQAEQTAAMGVWASSISRLSDALRLGEVSIPVPTQNLWRTRLLALRKIASEELGLLDKLK